MRNAYMNCPKTCLIEREKCSSLNWYLASKHVWFEWNWAMREHDPWHVVRCGRYQDVSDCRPPCFIQYNMQMFCIFLYLRPHRACFRNCEAQGKGRAKGRPRKVTQRSFIDCRWWMVDILSLMLYIKFGFAPYTRLLRHKYKKPPPQFSN